MNELFEIGQIINSRGLKGEIKIKPFSSLGQFGGLKEVQIDETLYGVNKISVSSPFVYLKIDGVGDKQTADSFRGKFVKIKRAEIPLPDEGEYFIADLIGYVFRAGDLNGKLKKIHQHGAADVFEIKLDGGGTVMFPFLKKLNLVIDSADKTISADKILLDTVAVYNKN